MHRNQVSAVDRRRIIAAFNSDDQNYKQVAETLGVNPSTARSIIRVYVTEGREDRLRMGGRTYSKVTERMRGFILELVDNEPFSTLQYLNDCLRRGVPGAANICNQTIARILEGHLITLKCAGKEADIPVERNTPRTIQNRQAYAQWFTDLGANDNVVYIDECGYNVYTRRLQGRAPIGQPVRQQVLGNRGKNVNLTLAINANVGLVHYSLSAETTTRVSFQNFLNHLFQVAANIFPHNETIHIVYDGARPHLRMTVPDNMQHRFTLRILPPYSPFLNPVEQAHSAFKALVKTQLTTADVREELLDINRRRGQQTLEVWRRDILMRIARESLNTITPQKCINWCGRVLQYIPRSLNGVPIEL